MWFGVSVCIMVWQQLPVSQWRACPCNLSARLSFTSGRTRPAWTAMELFLPLFLLAHLMRTSSHPEATVAAGPILLDRPFAVVWNIPTARCQQHYNVHLDLRDFDIVENRQQDFQGQVIHLPLGSKVPNSYWHHFGVLFPHFSVLDSYLTHLLHEPSGYHI